MTAPLFTAEGLAALRASNLASLTSRVRVDRFVRGPSQGGGANTGVSSWQPVDGLEDIPCRIAPAQMPAATTTADQPTNLARWNIATDVEAPIFDPGVRLTITGVELVTGEPWERVVVVVGARAPRTFSVMRNYDCVDAGPGQT